MTMKSAPRPVIEPPTDKATRPPPLVVIASVLVSLLRRIPGKTRLYHSLSVTIRNCRVNSLARSSL